MVPLIATYAGLSGFVPKTEHPSTTARLEFRLLMGMGQCQESPTIMCSQVLQRNQIISGSL